jgi:hypothetical protein
MLAVETRTRDRACVVAAEHPAGDRAQAGSRQAAQEAGEAGRDLTAAAHSR